ncbi:MAG: rhodanese-like domain-containing protein [Pseudomonadota bacterium]
MSLPEISPMDLANQQKAGVSWTIVDVREPTELAIAALNDTLHIPMGEIPARQGELPTTGHLGVLCHGGMRSARVTEYLINQGFTNCVNISGGIDRWSCEVDSGIARY